MDDYEVTYYQRSNGKMPVSIFLDELTVKMHAKMLSRIVLLAKNGPNLREPVCKSLGDGIFELRSQMDGYALRILYFFGSGKNVILTNGFVKKTNKTPREVIKQAKAFRKDYLQKER
ncbi:MAG: type II toxin-antitoxin system RelE/ParE family toxin [Erysipelotrichaceae bacterium]|nr:type II toxin-antitoxin system RelE/ParE family toxin [Erysipelotrichaceae bacterium]